MTHKCNPLDLAKWFINRVDRDFGDAITHLKLQKLLYYAQAWWLANFNESLFEEEMEAWTHGPVVPSIWQEFKGSNGHSIPQFEAEELDLDEKVKNHLEDVYATYGKYEAKELERLTHEELPWKQTRGYIPLEARSQKPIDKILMRDFYANVIGKTWQ